MRVPVTVRWFFFIIIMSVLPFIFQCPANGQQKPPEAVPPEVSGDPSSTLEIKCNEHEIYSESEGKCIDKKERKVTGTIINRSNVGQSSNISIGKGATEKKFNMRQRESRKSAVVPPDTINQTGPEGGTPETPKYNVTINP